MTRRGQGPVPARLRLLRGVMAERGIDALLVTQREAVRYLTGFSGSSGSVLVANGRPVLITDFRYELQAAKEAQAARVLIQKKDTAAAVREAADGLGVKALWVDRRAMTLEGARMLRKQGLRLRAVKDPVADLMMRKDLQELSALRAAIRRAEESFQELLPALRPGISERKIALRLEWLMRDKGSRKAAFDTIVASGPNGAMPHASVSDRKLRKGDLVTIDFGAEADGYFCDITRTRCIGRPTEKQRRVHGLVLKAQQAAIDAVAPGRRCRDIDRAAREVIAAGGHAKRFGHATGHGIGLMVHEGPSVSALSKDRVARNMVFTLEPGIYIPRWGGVRIEDMVLVGEQGCTVLTGLPREL